MEHLWQFGPHLTAMGVLVGCSAFFSGSEAALFYLQRDDRRKMRNGGPAARTAIELLGAPERLLSAILFWNLLVNIAYFSLASVAGIRLQRNGHATEASVISIGALLAIILISEMLPKNIAVLRPRAVASLVAFPLAIAVRILDPIMPLLRLVNLVSRRLLFPSFLLEPYLEIADLERAITLGTQDVELAGQEKGILQNVVALSQITVEEIMRPRLRYQAFQAPVHLEHLEGRLTPSGYVLVTEPGSDEIEAAIPLKRLSHIPDQHLEFHAKKVICVPWSAAVATALEELRQRDRDVAAVVNEHGETIGIVTIDDILETVLKLGKGRSERILKTASISRSADGTWIVNGMTTLRRLERQFGQRLPATKSKTVLGVLQHELQRLPDEGDLVSWGGLDFTVLQAPERGSLTVEIRLQSEGGTSA